MRQALIVGNWKLHGSSDGNEALIGELLAAKLPAAVEVAVCPTYVHLAQALQLCGGSQIGIGAQDCSHAASGAYTGEVSAVMLAEMGCQWVILGHSERRQYHSEADALVAAKITAALEAGLQPILCVGETREQREAGEAEAVVSGQLAGALSSQGSLEKLVVAYEPVWAIGTGLTASPEQAQEMHAYIRASLEDYSGLDPVATRLLYGGSVKPDNAAELFSAPDIDGALVGGAALKSADFSAIIGAALSP